jgi:undecaprenyl-diphosphatase
VVDTWRGARFGNTSRDYQSFPSGHSAAAFALAGVLAWYYPKAAALFWFLAVGCMAQRIIELAHWPTDCVVGAALGYLWAQIGLRIGR